MISRKGLTFVEVLITTCLVSVVALALFSMLSEGVSVWKRVNQAIPEEDLGIFFEKFSYELKNSFKYKNMDFKGTQTSISFPSFMRDYEQYAGAGYGMGTISYFYDEDDGVLSRSQRTISDIFQDKDIEGVGVLNGLNNFSFSYYFFNEDIKEYMWGSDWPPTNATIGNVSLPFGVRINMSSTSGLSTNVYNKFVYIPISKE